jgi:hypothetical protein
MSEQGDLTICELGQGTVIYGPSSKILNKAFMDDPTLGKTIASFLAQWKSPRVYFNEYYHGYQYETNSWQKLPSDLKAMALQLIVAIAVIVWFLGFRFGKPVPLIEGVERDESEYCLALANLQRKARMRDGALEDLQDALLRKSARAFHSARKLDKESLKSLWAARSLPGAKHIDAAFPEEEVDGKRLAQAAAAVSALEAILRKRAAKHSKSISPNI